MNKTKYILLLLLAAFATTKASSIINLIPDNTATHTAVNSGSWFAPSTWNTNTVPSSAAIVLIPMGFNVSYDQSSEAHIFAIKVHGTFTMIQTNSASTTKLIVDTFTGTMMSKIYIHANGSDDGNIDVVFKPFDIEQHKSADDKIYDLEWNAAAKAYFFDGLNHYKVTYKVTTTDDVDRFDDAADGNANTSIAEHSSVSVDDGPGVYGRSSWDSDQLSLGLATMGEIQILGKVKTTRLKLGSDASRNQNAMTLVETPVGWNAGDELVITTGGNQSTSNLGTDQKSIASITGANIITDGNLSYNHEGNSSEDLHCYVGNLTRNITFSSFDTSEVSRRGHVMAMHNPIDVQIRYAQFRNLGRTDKSRLADDFIFDKWIDPVVFTSKISALGQEVMQLKKPDANKITNSRGRYSIHLHRTGASNGTNAAYVEGNAVWGNPGWAITHHDSHAEITKNVVYDVKGAGIVSEAGNETGFWDDNLIVAIEKGRDGSGDAYTPVDGENYFDPDFYHSALYYDDYLFRGEGLAMRGRAVVSRNNVIADVNFGVGVTNINPVKTNLGRVDPEALAVLRPGHLIDHFPLDVNGYSTEGDGVMPVEVALLLENTTVIRSYTAMNSIERDMGVNHESRSVFDGFKSWGSNIGLQLTYQADYSFKNVYLSGKNMNSRGIDLFKHSSNHSFENIKIEDCETAIRVSKINGLGMDYLKLKTRNNGFTQWMFVNYSENNVTNHYALESDTEGATYVYNEHPDNIVYLKTDDVISSREIAFTLTDESDLEVDVAAEDFRFLVDGYISDSGGFYNYGVKSSEAQGTLRFDYPQRIYEFVSQVKFEEYLTANGVYKDAANGDQLYFIVEESVPDRLSFEYKTFPVRINILNAPNAAPYTSAVYESDDDLLPQTQLLSIQGTATQSSTSTSQSYEDVIIETPASRAIDGNTNGRLHAQFYQKGLLPVGSSSYTNVESEPWWEVDLQKDYNIESIEIWGTQTLNGVLQPTASDDFKNFFVMISDQPFGNSDLANAKTIATTTFYRGETGSQLFSKSNFVTKGRYVRIQGEGTRQLSLAEVAILGKEEGNRYCDVLEEGNIVVNGDFECDFDSDWSFTVSGNAIATNFNGAGESYEGAQSSGVTINTGDNYNKVVLKNKLYKGNLKDKTLKLMSYAKSPDEAITFRYQISIKNTDGVTTNKTSPIMNLDRDYKLFDHEIDITENTQEVQVKINLGKDVGTYYFDNVTGMIEDTLKVEDVEKEKNTFVFYPNPTNGKIFIEQYEAYESIAVVNTTGQLVTMYRVNSSELDVSILQEGIYILIANLKNGTRFSRKLIVIN